MKVVHLETGRHLYGGARQVLYLAEGLAEGGVESLVVCAEGSYVADAARAQSLSVRSLPWGGDSDLGAVARFGRLLSEVEPDLVHLHSRRGADSLGGMAARRAGIPTVLSRRVDNPEHRLIAAVKYKLYDRVIAISQVIRDVLVRQGVPPWKVELVHSAVRTSEWEEPASREALVSEFGLGEGPHLAMVAQFIERKGHQTLVDAMSLLDERGTAAHLVMFGQGPLEGPVARMVHERGLTDRITFAGFRDDLPRWLGAFDVLVHPALKEGLGVAVLQGGAAGLPVVASNAGGLPEVVVDGDTGFLTEPGDPRALADAITAVLTSEDGGRAMGNRGRRRIQAHFSVPAMVRGNLAVYRHVLER